jgi:hypothetical protein
MSVDIEKAIKIAAGSYQSDLESIVENIKEEVRKDNYLEKGGRDPSHVLRSLMYSAIARSHQLEILRQLKDGSHGSGWG